MNGKHPEYHDYLESKLWREYHSETQPPPKIGKNKPKTIRVRGMTLHNITPGERIDETNHTLLEENFEKLGIHPITEESPETPPSSLAGKTDFLELVPAEATTTKPKSKSSPPKKIERAWYSDTNRIMEIAPDDRKRWRALGSDGRRGAAAQRQKIREKMDLPKIAPSWKEMLRQFNALTEEDIAILKKLGWYEPTQIPPRSFRCERMLLDLKQYRESQKATIDA